MRYAFMDNYRGFAETLIPLPSATFLVGENSTGKSSFLTLVHLLSKPEFVFSPDSSRGAFGMLGGFRDIVSVTSADKSYFSIGRLTTLKKSRNKKLGPACTFSIMTFRDEEGLPRIYAHTYYAEGRLVEIIFESDQTYYKVTDNFFPTGLDGDSLPEFFLRIYRQRSKGTNGFAKLPGNVPRGAPLPLILGILNSKEMQETPDFATLFAEIPATFFSGIMSWTWLAPIRTRPLRIYEGFKTDFTPEGDHTPYLIRSTLCSNDKAKSFVELLKRFGESSGLFITVNAHSFGQDPSDPFEMMVELYGKALNISNVGYGVSQVLPVVVEMITRPKGHSFAIQQPEVHLHPRAQAALGDLMHFLVVEQDHSYIIETHSDYLIDRFRLRIKETGLPKGAQVVFFSRSASGNTASILKINEKGQYPREQPDEFRRFFINEEVNLLEI
jgi:hypothetical protein